LDLKYEIASELVVAVHRLAIGVNKPLSVCVVDVGGFVVAAGRMNGAHGLTPNVATAKAYTAAVMRRPTKLLKGWAESQPSLFAQVARVGAHPLIAGGGGIPLRKDGVFMGGIGVSGANGEEDQSVAESALRAAGFDIEFTEWNLLQK
jgi:uncharacterized protein GlcG (DUF336 family)